MFAATKSSGARRCGSPRGVPAAGELLLLLRLDDFGPAFVKVCAYFPYPMKIWVNGHEWAKRQAVRVPGMLLRSLMNFWYGPVAWTTWAGAARATGAVVTI